VHAWSDIPTALLQAELAKRQDATAPAKPECGTKKRGSYDTPLHVGALILILTLSTLGTADPSQLLQHCPTANSSHSLCVSHHRPPLPQTSHSSPGHLPLPSLRHRRPHSHGIRAPLPNSIHIPHGPMSPLLLEYPLSGYAGPHRHALSPHRCGH
jgi:hypothetical protein